MTSKLDLDNRGIQATIDWPMLKRILTWLRHTVIVLALGGGGFNVYDTRLELADIKTRLTRCEEAERENRRIIHELTHQLPPGNNPGGTSDGPPITDHRRR